MAIYIDFKLWQRQSYIVKQITLATIGDVTGVVNTYSDRQYETEYIQNEHCIKNLNILSLNVCGLTRKQVYPELKSLINEHDIIGFQESKMDCLDSFTLDNYTLFYKHRKQVSKRESGGIKTVLDNIFLIETESRLVYWFIISKRFTKTDDILCGVIYVPPENSIYSVQDPFLEIQREIDSFSNKYTFFGDFLR